MILRPDTQLLGEQILSVLITPPLIALCFWVLGRGLATQVRGGSASDETKRRLREHFWTVLLGVYAIAIGTFIYAHFTKH
jgi:hypothetical protein